MRLLIISGLAILCASCGQNSASSINASSEGVFYTAWNGAVYRIQDDQMTEIKKSVRDSVSTRKLKITQDIPTAIPEKVLHLEGVLKLGSDDRRFKITATIANKDGTPLTETASTSLVETPFLLGINGLIVRVYDSEGFLVDDPKEIAFPGDWMGLVNSENKKYGWEFTSRESASADKNAEVQDLMVGWR